MDRLETATLAFLLAMTTGTAAGQVAAPTAIARVGERVNPSNGAGPGESGPRAAARPSVSTIRGNALTAEGAGLSSAPVRLRNVRTGHDVKREVADRTGLFEFAAVDPGSYVVELLSPERHVLATSEIVHVGAGDTVSTIVQLAGARPAGVFRSAITALSAAAAGAGLLSKTATGAPVSPRQ
jgi:hypothetical protein